MLLVGFSVVFWSTLQSSDKEVIRWSLVASALYNIIQIIGMFFTYFPMPPVDVFYCFIVHDVVILRYLKCRFYPFNVPIPKTILTVNVVFNLTIIK